MDEHPVVPFTPLPPPPRNYTSVNEGYSLVADPGEGPGGPLPSYIRELKQQRRRRLQKRHFKREFTPLQTLSRLFHLVYFIKCWQMFLELNSEGLY